jgi:hypothetical protein
MIEAPLTKSERRMSMGDLVRKYRTEQMKRAQITIKFPPAA